MMCALFVVIQIHFPSQETKSFHELIAWRYVVVLPVFRKISIGNVNSLSEALCLAAHNKLTDAETLDVFCR